MSRHQLAFLVVVIALAAAGRPAFAGQVTGDVNCTGGVNSIDATIILQLDAGLISSVICIQNGDVNGDGAINSLDATLILQLDAGLISVLPGAPTEQALTIHHIDVEQGDAALIVSPGGEVVMVDSGRWTNCANTVSYVEGLGISSIDYHFASHYHADHIGCLDELAAAGITVEIACFDRGGSLSPATDTFSQYVATCGERRQTLVQGQVITLDEDATPVTITVIALDGAGISTSSENAKSLVLKLTYGAFDEVFGGDLTGEDPDIESAVAGLVGDVEVYKVHHHGSRFSSNDIWLDATSPEVAIISVGNNSFGHPTADALARLHSRDVRTYWTNLGSGASLDPAFDRVAGNIVIEARPGIGAEYTVSGAGFTDMYQVDGGTAPIRRTTSPQPPSTPPPTLVPQQCDPSYPTVCIPPFPPDLNCGDIPYRRFPVLEPDPHGFDGDNDGIGCESG